MTVKAELFCSRAKSAERRRDERQIAAFRTFLEAGPKAHLTINQAKVDTNIQFRA